MTYRALPIINAIGCLLLTCLVVVQWRGERAAEAELASLRAALATAGNQAAEDAKHRANLERDIAALKESIEATQQAAETAARGLAEKDLLATRLQTDLAAARDQVTRWETALKARDERIRTLDQQLAATRKRLDEAVARLKAAGDR